MVQATHFLPRTTPFPRVHHPDGSLSPSSNLGASEIQAAAMTEVQRAPMDTTSHPQTIPERTAGLEMLTPPSISMTALSSVTKPLKGHLNLDTFSPVNQNGSFEFDRVLKSGYVQKRTRKTKAWKLIYLVLRPNLLSIYKDQNEVKLRHKLLLSDLTAVTLLKDPKQKRQNVFGLFSPSRNYHLEGQTKKDAEEWVELIRKEARIEEEEEEMFLASPGGNVTGSYGSFEHEMQKQRDERQEQDERLASSSPEPGEPLPRLPKQRAVISNSQRRPSRTLEYSGNELGSHSDFSDVDHHPAIEASTNAILEEPSAVNSLNSSRPVLGGRNISQMSVSNVEQDPERVVWQGYLLYLRSKGGVRQWKDLWAVLRLKNLALYKDEGEYSPRLIIPLSSIINAVEIDPVSKSKVHCMQLITEEKSYRFCAHSEESLDKSLGAFKSLLAKRKENEGKRHAGSRLTQGG